MIWEAFFDGIMSIDRDFVTYPANLAFGQPIHF